MHTQDRFENKTGKHTTLFADRHKLARKHINTIRKIGKMSSYSHNGLSSNAVLCLVSPMTLMLFNVCARALPLEHINGQK